MTVLSKLSWKQFSSLRDKFLIHIIWVWFEYKTGPLNCRNILRIIAMLRRKQNWKTLHWAQIVTRQGITDRIKWVSKM